MDVALTGHGVEQFATERLIGRRLLPADSEFLVDLHQDERVMELNGGVRDRSISEPFVQSNVAHWRHYQFGLYILSRVEDPDQPVGRAGIRWDRAVVVDPVVDTSVVLCEDAWGQGLATEAVAAITAIGLDLGLPLVAGAQARHGSARRVLDKVGFEHWMDYERSGLTWVRYHWPSTRHAPATIVPRSVPI